MVIRIFLGGFMILAGALKALDPAAFQESILAYQIVGYPVSFILAYWLPPFEVMLGLTIVFRFHLPLALKLFVALLTVFILALSWTWWSGIDLDCGCFGKLDWVSDQPGAIFRDLIWILMAIYLLSMPKERANDRA